MSIVFDLTASGYAAFDNLSITASTGTAIVDGDLDGKPDDADNCRKIKNASGSLASSFDSVGITTP